MKDGPDGQPITMLGGGDNRPSVEAYEIEYPVRFRRFQLWPDSGGPGKWRGGTGLWRGITALDDVEVTVRAADRCRKPPRGIAGGKSGKGGGWIINQGAANEINLPSKKTNQPMRAGDTLTMLMSGGGGFGDPWEREPALVAKDVAEGTVTVTAAADDYAVVVDPLTLRPDLDATLKLPSKRSASAA